MPRERNRFRVSHAPMLAVGCFLLATVSQVRVQTFGRHEILEEGQRSGRFVVRQKLKARRGPVLSADEKALAVDEDGSELVVDFRKVPNSPAFFMDLGAACGIPPTELMHLKASGAKSRTWQELLSPEQARAVQQVKIEWRADGVSAARMGMRSYPLGSAAATVVGYLRDGKALGGLEASFDQALQGEDGLIVGMVDRSGDYLPLRTDPESKNKRDGEPVTLTIDSELQLAAASAVRQAVESNKADQGCAVVIEPSTGDVLAMASWPSFDPVRFGAPGEKTSDFNPAIMAKLEPGSTFKILTLALALDEKVVQMSRALDCKGSWQVWPTRAVRCDAHGGKRAHGMIGPVDAIAKSCNVSAAHWAVDIRHEPFTEFLKAAGLLEKTKVGLPGEIAGSYNKDEYAKRLQLATFGFGQSLTCTPLALCSAFSMLGNGGIRMAPRLVARVGGRNVPLKEAGRLLSEETAGEVMMAMETVFSSDHGTGKTLRIPGYRLAGKTGTAEKRQGGSGGYVSNFVGFVPAEKPKAAILVMIDNPKAGRYYGASVAGPVFQDVAKAVIRRYGIPSASRSSSNGAGALSPSAPKIEEPARASRPVLPGNKDFERLQKASPSLSETTSRPRSANPSTLLGAQAGVLTAPKSPRKGPEVTVTARSVRANPGPSEVNRRP